MPTRTKGRLKKEIFQDLALRVDSPMQRWATAYYRLQIDKVLKREDPDMEKIVLHIDGTGSAVAALPFIDIWSCIRSFRRFIVASAVIFCVGFLAMNAGAYYDIIRTSVFGLPDVITPITEKMYSAAPAKPLPLIKNARQQKQYIPAMNLNVLPPDDRIIIPKIGRNLPIIHTSSTHVSKSNWDVLQEELLQDLQRGVVHFPGTANPGEKGNVFITGHSSYYPWDPGKFKDAFALLGKLTIGDKVYVVNNQKRYVYEITERKVVAPSDIDVLEQTNDYRLTLMTCTPVGTNLKRLVFIAKLIET